MINDQDAEERAKRLAYMSQWYRNKRKDPEWRERQRQQQRARYNQNRDDPLFMERGRKHALAYYYKKIADPEFVKKNRAKVAAALAKKRLDPDFREKERLRAERNRAKEPEKRRASVAASRRNHPETRKAEKHRRRAAERNAGGTFTSDDWISLVARSPRCYWCGSKFTSKRPPTHDHVIALARGGTNSPENSVCACAKCNMRKNAGRFNPSTGQGILL